jgi:alkaline phosphatase D
MVMQCDELNDPTRTMLGATQERWLGDSLSQSKRQWKLVAQATQISPTNVPAPVGRSYWNEAWDGYPEARKRLLQTVVDAKLNNVVTLGGDVHCNVAANLRLEPNNPQSPIVASEFVTTSITSRGLGDKPAAVIRESNPDLLHYRSDERGFSLITVTPKEVRCDFRTTKFPAGVETGFKTQASYRVKSGKPGPQAV